MEDYDILLPTIVLDIYPAIFTANYEVALQIWDIGGQSIGSKMVTNYISGAHAVLLCYDITNSESFANLEDWHRIVCRTFNDQPKPYMAIVGNKSEWICLNPFW